MGRSGGGQRGCLPPGAQHKQLGSVRHLVLSLHAAYHHDVACCSAYRVVWPRPGHVGRCVGRTCRQPRQIVNCTSQKWVYHEVAVRRQDLIRAPQSFHAPSASSCRVPNAQSASSCRFLAATTRTIMTVHGSFIWHLLDSPKQRSPETYQRPLIDQNDADQRGGTRVRPQMPESTDAEMVVWSAEGKLRAVCLLHHARAPNCRLQSERLTSLLHPFFPRRGEGCFVRR